MTAGDCPVCFAVVVDDARGEGLFEQRVEIALRPLVEREHDGVLGIEVIVCRAEGYLSLPDADHLDLRDALTLEVVLYPRPALMGAAYPHVARYHPYLSRGDLGFQLMQDGDALQLWLRFPGQSEPVLARAPVPADWYGAWHRLALANGHLADLVAGGLRDGDLVVGLRLGCLNHALLTAQSIRASSGLVLAGWVANQVEPHFAHARENVALLERRLDNVAYRLGFANTSSAGESLCEAREGAESADASGVRWLLTLDTCSWS